MIEVRIERGGSLTNIELDEREWGLFMRRYGEDALQRLCATLLDPTLSLTDIARVFGVSVSTVWVWKNKLEPRISAAHRVVRKQGTGAWDEHKQITLEVGHGGAIVPIKVAHIAYSRFEHRHGDMREFLSLLVQECHTLKAVGERYGMTREMARLYYRRYLAPVLEAKNGRERQRACTLARVHIKQFPDSVLAVWRMARRWGLSVSVVNVVSRDEKVHTMRTALWLSDRMCRIHIMSSDTAREGFVCFNIGRGGTQEKFSFHIYVIRFAERHWRDWVYYVIPLDKIPEVQSFTLPFLSPAERGIVRETPWLIKYDWASYRDAWHLIPASK